MLKTTGKIKLYNLDNGCEASKWVREEIKGIKTQDAPQLSSPLNIKDNGLGNIIANSLGYFHNDMNSVYVNQLSVGLYSSTSSRGHGLSVIPANFLKVCALFTARKSIKSTWVNQKIEYISPNTSHEDYDQWNRDAVIYALFNNSSNQSSLRNVSYKGDNWDIENEWFFMSHDEMKELADETSYDDLFNDVKRHGKDRYVYNELQSLKLSVDAKELLDMAKELVRKTFKYREIMNEEHPEYNLQSWDAGWYQIKLIAKEYCKDDLKEFTKKYKAFEDRMREGVYKFGFLK